MSFRALALGIAVVIGACGPAPTPTPDDMPGVLNELSTHGVQVQDILAGDAGCPGSELHSNGSRLAVTFSLDGQDYDLYLLRWRRQSDYDSADQAFRGCVTEYTAARGSIDVDIVEVSPFRAFGGGWTESLREAIEQALAAAAAGQ